MTTYERSVRVAAPFEEVWAFHSRVEGLEGLTPAWLNLQVESIDRAGESAGSSDRSAVLDPGDVLTLSVQPGGVGPRQQWVSEITARNRADGAAYFRDVMHEGPFPSWEHTHLFYRDGDRTLCRDHVEYTLPLGGLGRRLGPLAVVGFEPMFRYRHRQTKALLE